jgi:hypothetical protein
MAEFHEMALGDARLERRLWRVAEELSGQPQYPINQASEDAAATKAACRLFNNERVTAEEIFLAHRARTRRRMHNEPAVLAVQDTSFFHYSRPKRTPGLGPIADKDNHAPGLIMPATLAVTPQGLPLGVLAQRCRAGPGYRATEEEHERKPMEEKESYRWVETLREVAKLSVWHRASMVVTVADRESDIDEFLLEAQKLNAKDVMRACCDRHIKSDVDRTIHEPLAALDVPAQGELEVPTQSRRARLDLKFMKVD